MTDIPMLSPDMREEFELRLEKVRGQMKPLGLDAVLVADNANLFYISGMVFRGFVYIPLDPAEKPLFCVIRPQTLAAGPQTFQIRKPEDIPSLLESRSYASPAVIGLEFDSLSYNEVERLKKAFAASRAEDASRAFVDARMVKTDYEIEQMRSDGVHQAAVYHNIDRLYEPDMTDLEFQIAVERSLRREGCLGYLRTSGRLMEINMGSVVAGANADNPTPYDFAMGGSGVDPSLPVGADGHIMRRGETVMVDMNGTFNGYQTDMTRTWALGDVPELARRAHQCSRDILRCLEKMALPGVEVSALYHAALEIVKEQKLEAYFMGHRQQAKFIGHGVGIQLNEQPAVTPRSKTLLEENMTLALEPKFVIPGVGAVGVENTYRVTAEGLQTLTSFPEELMEL